MIRLGALGDVVRTLPAVSSLRAGWAGAHVTWLVEPAAAGALDGQPWVDEVLVFPRGALRASLARRDLRGAGRAFARFARALRRRRYDLVVDFHAIARSALLARLSGAARRVTYARPFGRELAWLAATDRARLEPARASRFERNQALVRHLGIHAPPAPLPFVVEPQARARMSAALGSGPAPVAIHAGSSAGAAHKRYAPERLGEVARLLRARDGRTSVATWGPAAGDRDAAEALVAASDGAAALAPQTPRVADLGALLACACAFVSADTGPLHVASLVGTPVVQIQGPTDPVENAPWPGTPFRVVCAETRRTGDVEPPAVAGAVRELLAGQAFGAWRPA